MASKLDYVVMRLRALQVAACGRQECEEFQDMRARMVWEQFQSAIRIVRDEWPITGEVEALPGE